MEAFVAPALCPEGTVSFRASPAMPAARRAFSPLAGEGAGATVGLYALLMARAAGHASDDLYARMLVSQVAARSALPAGLGLDAAAFRALMAHHFPGFSLPAPLAHRPNLGERGAEWDELHALLLEFQCGEDARSETWMASIVASACMGGDHLWQDLGLWTRADLTQLMARNFPGLSALNQRDMKWKKFLYKQLCERNGVYVCRSPSCEVCVDYAKCFGPKD